MCYLCMEETEKGRRCLISAVERSEDLVLDKQLGAYACAEVGFLYMDQGNYVQAKKYLKTASHDYQGYFLESRLHFRIHSALHKLKKIEKEHKLSRKKAKKNNITVEESVSDDSEYSEAASNYSTASEGEKRGEVLDATGDENFVDAKTHDTREACSSNIDADGESDKKQCGSKPLDMGPSKPTVSQNPSNCNNNNKQESPNLLLETSL